ncbi:LADA_0D05644g1_1 [Lachancea dasiensis]|uniref:LADA_0D05644g1_1 n=1 Tax=Lachancea dasiensis TaxID=1072105 RepID=A0A1G4J5I4_9SACH|nr:LADA_0D05644g1_1 [Lachancea dasiensis]
MIVVVLVGLLALVYNYVIYPLCLNELIKQKIPGPLLYKLSSIFILNETRRGKRNSLLQQLHQTYGPVVMIGPGEVSLNSLKLKKDIYLRNFPKEYFKDGVKVTGFYSQFSNFGQHNMFSTGDNATHLAKKRPLQQMFSKSSILASEGFVRSQVEAVKDKIINYGNNANVNVYSLFSALAMDVVSGTEYGTKFSTNFVDELSHSSKTLKLERSIFDDFRDNTSLWFYVTLCPALLPMASKWKKIDGASARSASWMYKNFEKALNAVIQNEDVNSKDFPIPTVIETMFAHRMRTSGGKFLPDDQLNAIASEIADQVVAGHETTGITLSYLFWELSRPANAHWQEKLRKDVKGFRDSRELDDKPVLNAILQETLRLHAAIPGLEPRFVPAGKTLNCSIGQRNFAIPEGTVVAMQPWTLHRLPVFGPDPDIFKPERWLRNRGENEEAFSARMREMSSAIFTFGQGNRMCIGMHLALCQIKLCMASLFSQFQTRISSDWCPIIDPGHSAVKVGMQYGSTDLDKMSMADAYTTHPIHHECWLQFENIQDGASK